MPGQMTGAKNNRLDGGKTKKKKKKQRAYTQKDIDLLDTSGPEGKKKLQKLFKAGRIAQSGGGGGGFSPLLEG